MTTYVALLRGVNVGKAKRVPMVDLRRILAALGHSNVTTLLNSGNAVFDARGGDAGRHAATISAAIAAELHVDVPVIVKRAEALRAVVAANPIAVDVDDHPRLLVAFAQDSAMLAGLAALERLVVAPERFALGSEAAYLLCSRGILQSKAASALLGKAGAAATTRNWATVLKLEALARGGSS
jgi:uncharacterized protein (DUF1697 family)